jgi:hypothetical protein
MEFAFTFQNLRRSRVHISAPRPAVLTESMLLRRVGLQGQHRPLHRRENLKSHILKDVRNFPQSLQENSAEIVP